MYLFQMDNQQLAQRILTYINRAEALRDAVSQMIDAGFDKEKKASIMRDYKDLKESIRDDAREAQRKEFSRLELTDKDRHVWGSSIYEAAACGFTSRVGSAIDFKLFSSVEEAHYKLTKHYSKERWEEMAQS